MPSGKVHGIPLASEAFPSQLFEVEPSKEFFGNLVLAVAPFWRNYKLLADPIISRSILI